MHYITLHYNILYYILREFPCDTHVILASGACETRLRSKYRVIASGRRRPSEFPLLRRDSGLQKDSQHEAKMTPKSKVTKTHDFSSRVLITISTDGGPLIGEYRVFSPINGRGPSYTIRELYIKQI